MINYKNMLILVMLLPLVGLGQGYATFDGGRGDQLLNFSIGAAGFVGKHGVGDLNFYYSDNKEVFSASIGIVPYQNKDFKVIALWGAEINNSFEPIISGHAWIRITNEVWATLNVRKFDRGPYFGIGLAVEAIPSRKKCKRFF